MIGSLIIMLIFLSGAFFAIFLMSRIYLAAILIGVCGFILIFTVIGLLKRKKKDVNEAILTKAAYIYILMGDDHLCSYVSPTLRKEVSKIMTEIAALTSGIDSTVEWVKQCMIFKNALEKLNEEDNKNADE